MRSKASLINHWSTHMSQHKSNFREGELDPPEMAFNALMGGIDICFRETTGEVGLLIRRMGRTEVLEINVFSLRGSFRCHRGDLQRFLECRSEDEQSPLSKYRERFRRGLLKVISIGFGSLKLDFSKCSRDKTHPKFYLTITDICGPD